MSSVQIAEQLRSQYGFNCIPLLKFVRYTTPEGEAGKDVMFEKGYANYRSEQYPLQEWPPSAANLAIITGHISNLTIVDVDSEEARRYIENHTGEDLEALSSYVIKTNKGWQLFFAYDPSLKTTTGLDNLKLDILNDGRQTFAHEVNPGYITLKQGPLTALPPKLKEFLSSDSRTLSTTHFLFEEERVRVFRNPLTHLLREAMGSARLSKVLKQKLEKIFCSGDWTGRELNNKWAGSEDSFLTHCIGIVAHDPTVDEETFQEFMPWFYEKLIRAKTDTESLRPKYFRLPWDRGWWEYDPEWAAKTEMAMDVKAQAGANNLKLWADPENSQYAIYNLNTGETHKYAKMFFLDRVAHYLSLEVNTQELEQISDVFTPEILEEFYVDDRGRKVRNLFRPTEELNYFQIVNPLLELPYYTGKILENLFPEPLARELFLHNLAHHLRYRKVMPTAWIVTGAGGSGKNVFFDLLLGKIYGAYHSKAGVQDFTGPYQDAIFDKLFIFVDETEEGGKAVQLTPLITALKKTVGNLSLSGRKIYRGPITSPNHLFIVLGSNNEVPVTLDNGKDRRFNVSHTGPNLTELTWYQSLKEDLVEVLEEEIQEFLAYLAGLKTSEVRARTILENEARKQLVSDSTPLHEKVGEALLNLDPDLLPPECEEEVYLKLVELRDYNLAYLEVAHLKEILPHHAIKVAKYLAKKGVVIKQLAVQGRNPRCIVFNPQGRYKKEETLKFDKPNMGGK